MTDHRPDAPAGPGRDAVDGPDPDAAASARDVRGTAYHVVDVFARDGERYTGNQLAVFHDTADLADGTLLALARETNFSECTFVGGTSDGGRDVRIFDPAEEIPFAGHPTLGTAAVLRELVDDLGGGSGGANRRDELTLNLGVGPIDVWVEPSADGADERREEYWMRQVPPEFGGTVPREDVAAALGLDAADVEDGVPVQSVSTGLPTLVVPLASFDAVERAATTEPAYGDLIAEHGGHNLLVVARGGVDGGDLHARVFADWAGVPEDPATGSAAGCLAGWLLEHGSFDREHDGADGTEGTDTGAAGDTDTERISATVEQGYEMGRPSRLRLRAERSSDGEGIAVEVGGEVVAVAEGRLL